MARPRSEFSRMKVPADAVRTREAILAGAHVAHGMVWETCHNCGGSGKYPSGCIPAGLCRFYCWAVTTGRPDTSGNSMNGMEMVSRIGTKFADVFGMLPVSIDKYVKRQEAADRREYRTRVWLEATREEREAEQATRDAERLERETEKAYWEEAKRAAVAARRHVGSEGERITLDVRVEGVHSFDGRFGTSYIVRMRDAESNQVVWFTGSPSSDLRDAATTGQRVNVTATVKRHDTYQGEAQTQVTRVKVNSAEPAQAVA